MQKFSKLADQAKSSETCSAYVIKWPEGLEKWNLVNDYLKLRKKVFIDRLDWPLFHAEELEFEQYDTLDTVYVVATSNGKTIGGARLRRTDQTNGKGSIQYSYMIRDACLGCLPGLPDDLCDVTPPMDKDVWEITRMVVNGPRSVFALILRTANDFLKQEGAKSVLFLGSPAFQRMADAWSWPVRTLGPVVGNKDGQFRVFECPVQDLKY